MQLKKHRDITSLIKGNLLSEPVTGRKYYIVCIEKMKSPQYIVKLREYKGANMRHYYLRAKLFINEQRALRMAEKLNKSHSRKLQFQKVLAKAFGIFKSKKYA